MTNLTQRLRGHYRIPITDGLGAAGGEEPNNPNEFVRTFQTPPIQHEAADVIETMLAALYEVAVLGHGRCTIGKPLSDMVRGAIAKAEGRDVPTEALPHA